MEYSKLLKGLAKDHVSFSYHLVSLTFSHLNLHWKTVQPSGPKFGRDDPSKKKCRLQMKLILLWGGGGGLID